MKIKGCNFIAMVSITNVDVSERLEIDEQGLCKVVNIVITAVQQPEVKEVTGLITFATTLD